MRERIVERWRGEEILVFLGWFFGGFGEGGRPEGFDRRLIEGLHRADPHGSSEIEPEV